MPLELSALALVGAVAATGGASLTHFDGDHKEEAAEALPAFDEIMVSTKCIVANVLCGAHHFPPGRSFIPM